MDMLGIAMGIVLCMLLLPDWADYNIEDPPGQDDHYPEEEGHIGK